MKNSLKKLLDKFPYFLDKSSSSNFTKSETVFNNRFVEIYNDLFKTYLAGKVDKHLFVWKEQSMPYVYNVHFAVTVPRLKEVCIVKMYEVLENVESDSLTTSQFIEEEIYTKTFENDDEDSMFYYIVEESSENIIPTEKYKITVKTYDEKTLTKGFPENDSKNGDEFDHDQSLDEFGAFINLPRRKYLADVNDYSNTEPPYNNMLTEDDYHYANRIMFYLQHLQDTPLPILEIWKLLGININHIQLLNRERLLCKMFSIERHSRDGVYNEYWNPARMEHKDKWCAVDDGEKYLFAEVNNSTPLQLQDFSFQFRILNDLGRSISNKLSEDEIISESDESFFIVPFVNGIMWEDVLLSDETWTINTRDIDFNDSRFVFKCFSTLDEVEEEKLINNGVFTVFENDVVSDEILVNVRGCNSADWYVDYSNGDDSNDGLTRETPFKTINKAISVVEGAKNIVVLSDDVHYLEDIPTIRENTKIISCLTDNPIIVGNSDVFFHINQGKSLYLQNINLGYSDYISKVEDTTFINNNLDNNQLNVVTDYLEILALDTNHNVDLHITDDTSLDEVMVLFSDCETDFNVIITENENTPADFIILEDGTNCNLVIKDD